MVVDFNYGNYGNPEEWLWHLLNNLGCCDLEICISYHKSDGTLFFSKWLKVMDLLHLDSDERVPQAPQYTRSEFIQAASHRTVLDIEILLDIDEKGEYSTIKDKTISILRRLVKLGINSTTYFTGSKSYHISVLEPMLREMSSAARKRFKSLLLGVLGGDLQKSANRTMIALEGAVHYRSGQPKIQVTL